MTKYRLVDDIDLTRHVATPAGVAYFHKPIGAPIGGGSGGTAKVALKAVSNAFSIFDPESYGQFGQSTKVERAHTTVPQSARDLMHLVAGGDRAKPKPAVPAGVVPDGAQMADVKNWYDDLSEEAKTGLTRDLGLDPQYKALTVKQLRKKIVSTKTADDERVALKHELAERVNVARQATSDAKSLASDLTEKLEKTPKAELPPIIGETLAAHPHLGPLAPLWDRLRLGGYNFKKSFKGAGTDELPRIIARNVASVMLGVLFLHLGLDLPMIGG